MEGCKSMGLKNYIWVKRVIGRSTDHGPLPTAAYYSRKRLYSRKLLVA
jgi:hypothetical protein